MVAISGAQQTNLRKDGFAMRVYATALHNPTPVCVTTVNAVVDYTTLVKTLSLNTSPSSGALASIIPNTLVEIYDSSARYKGAVRVATGGYSGGTLQIAEIGKNHVYIVNGDTVKVYHSPMVVEKLVGNDAQFLPDGRVTLTNQTSLLSPRANTGGHWVGWVDAGQTYATVVFAGSLSYATDPDSGGTVTYAWAFGSSASPTTSTSANPSVQFNIGYHLVSLTVTDSSNSKTRTQYLAVRVHDATNLPTEVVINGLGLDAENGGNTSITLYTTDYNLTNLPNESFVALWAEQVMLDDTALDMGHAVTGRSHILFIGKLQRESAIYNYDQNTVTFELIAPLNAFQNINAYAKLLTEQTPQGAWDYFEDLSTKIALEFLPDYYTTLCDWFDYSTASFTSFDWTGFSIDSGTAYDQISDLIEHRAYITQDRTGRILIWDNPNLVDVGAGRNALDTLITLTEDDLILNFNYTRDHQPRLQRLRGEGFNSSEGDIYSDYPSTTPGRGNQSVNVTKMLVSDQTALNVITGHWGAYQDNIFIDANGQLLLLDEIEIELPAQYFQVFTGFYPQWVALNISTSDLAWKRGINTNNWRYLVIGVSLTFNHEDSTGITRVRLKPETARYPASTYTPATLPSIVNTIVLQPLTPTFPSTWDDLLGNQEGAQNGLIVTVDGEGLDGLDDGIEDGTFSLHGGAVLCYVITQYISNCMAVAYQIKSGGTLSGTIDLEYPNILLVSGVFLPLGTTFAYTAGQILTAWQDEPSIELVRCAMETALANMDVTTTIFADALNGYSGGANDTIIAVVVDTFNNFYGNLYAFIHAMKKASTNTNVGTVAGECDCLVCADVIQLFQEVDNSQWNFLPTNGTTEGTFFITDGSSFGGEPFLLAGQHYFVAPPADPSRISFVKISGIDPTCLYSGASLDVKIDDVVGGGGDPTNISLSLWDTNPPYANYLTYIGESGQIDTDTYSASQGSTDVYITLTLSFTPQVFADGIAVFLFGASGSYTEWEVRACNFRLTE